MKGENNQLARRLNVACVLTFLLRSTVSRALKVIDRVSAKLRGKDFSKEQTLGVPQQVQRLIDQVRRS